MAALTEIANKTMTESDIARIQDLLKLLYLSEESSHQKYPDVNSVPDFRITFFIRLINSHYTTMLAMLHPMADLNIQGWWEHNKIEKPTPKDLSIFQNAYDQFMRTNFFFSVFCSLERAFRILIGKLVPDKPDLMADSFGKIYCHPTLNLSQEERNLLIFMGCVRNSLHLDGEFFPPRKKHKHTKEMLPQANRTYTYREKEFNFIVGEKVKDMHWPVILNISQDVIVLWSRIITTGPGNFQCHQNDSLGPIEPCANL